MALGWKTRRRLALVVLLVGLPAWIVAGVSVVGMLDRPGWAVELAVYLALGIGWALPLGFIFRGVGREDPEAAQGSAGRRGAGQGDGRS